MIDTKLTIRDGKIVEHEDLFSWERWSAQALPFGRFSELPALRWTVTRALRAVVRHS